MKQILIIILILMPAASCQSTENAIEQIESDILSFPNLHEPRAPDTSDFVIHTVYIDHVEIVKSKGARKVLVQGNLPNPCCTLNKPEVTITNGYLHLTMKAWQARESICAQVLQPFSYLHPLPETIVSDPEQVYINDTLFEL
jgi:hypothetical protein